MIFARRVVGDSMLPTLKHGQIVWAYRSRDFRVGRVVVALIQNREVIKRVKNIEKGKVFLQGDNSQHSTDSRTYGTVGDQYVEGVVFWPRV